MIRSKILWLVFVACSGKLADAPASDEIVRLSRDDSQWVMAAKNYANTRFSGLDQINTDNVKRLRVAWTFSTGVLNGHEAAPLVIKDTMYVVTPWPNILYALDLKQAGAIKWVYRPNPSRAAQGVACCDVVNAARPTPRKNLLQHAGQSYCGGRCHHRQGSVENQAG